MTLNTEPNLATPDDFYEELIDLHPCAPFRTLWPVISCLSLNRSAAPGQSQAAWARPAELL